MVRGGSIKEENKHRDEMIRELKKKKGTERLGSICEKTVLVTVCAHKEIYCKPLQSVWQLGNCVCHWFMDIQSSPKHSRRVAVTQQHPLKTNHKITLCWIVLCLANSRHTHTITVRERWAGRRRRQKRKETEETFGSITQSPCWK